MDLILDWFITDTYTSSMRLTGNEISAIKYKTRKNFGSRAVVYLFGSRTDDSKKGGDIDLYIETEYTGVELIKRKLKFITDLQFAIGERKIDVVASTGGDEKENPALIIKNAKKNGIML